ncbi:hypothetical protein KIPB_016709, partial [Kipferlia bialata]
YPRAVCVGVDINRLALSVTGHTHHSHCVLRHVSQRVSKYTPHTEDTDSPVLHPVQLVEGSLLTCISPRAAFDVVVFNPPYVPSPPPAHFDSERPHVTHMAGISISISISIDTYRDR